MAVEYLLFQSTLPRGERQYFYQQNHLPPKFQSTLPRGERPDRLNGQCIIRFISIHAPARGATLLPSLSFLRQFISIHAPARGATSCYQALVDRIGNFNPRSREGSDALKQSAFCIIIISIHAPARGATLGLHNFMPDFQFQSTLPRGERRFVHSNPTFLWQFQSTLPRGERL